MIDLSKYFDVYNRKARVYPALIAGLPTLAFLFVVVPWDHVGLPHLTALTMSVVLLFAFADVARMTGKKVQEKLGTGTTPQQWYRGNPDVAEASKDRYRNFIARQMDVLAPTEADERADPHRANDFYLSAGNWLREHTRDTKVYAILFGENITYGFRRNLLGLKPVALVSNVIVAAACVLIIYLRPRYFADLANIDEKVFVIILASLLHSAFMLLAVGQTAVRNASRAYGRQLILSCETLMKPQRTSSPKKARRSDASR